ncbi:MAG: histidine kinase dimerization/phospho-acceptor domain-containing protein [Cyanobacteriota bacterium]|nr:histidine kinase dimerization/phospho-acceptor domain-containing protein [Cyanobacteriota bacterium]
MNAEMDWKFAFERSQMLREFQSELLVSIGHELRNPLSSQMGSLQLILSDLCDSPEEEREYVGAAKQSVEKLLKLLEDYTRLARHHLPIQPLSLEVLPLQPIFQDVYHLTLLQAHDQGIRYDWSMIQTPQPCDLVALADPHGLVQALLGICRWSIRRLRYGTMLLTAQPSPTAPTHIQLDLKLEGRCQFPVDPEESLSWRVSQTLLRQMQGDLLLQESSSQRLGIRALLSSPG